MIVWANITGFDSSLKMEELTPEQKDTVSDFRSFHVLGSSGSHQNKSELAT